MWHISARSSDRINLVGYIALFAGALIGLGTYVYPDELARASVVISAALTVVGIFLTFWASGVRTRYGDREIAEAQKSAAEANKRASALVLEAEELRARMAGRRLTEQQFFVLTHALGGARPSGKVWFQVQGEDYEARQFWSDIGVALDAAEVGVERMTAAEYSGVGLVVGGGSAADRTTVKSAFDAAGILIDEDAESEGGLLVLAVLGKPPLY